MQVNEENILGLRNYLTQTLDPNAAIRRQAEEFLKSVEKQQGYTILLLKLIEQSSQPQDAAIRQSAAVLFKNVIKNNWDPEKDGGSIGDADRTLIKTHIVNLMCSMPDQIQKQLSTALATIGEYDFPHNWQNLLPELVTKFNSDWRVINGVLLTANTIFKRFRHVFKSDELYRELKHCLEQFQQPLLDLFKHATTSLSNSNSNKEQAALIVSAMRTMCRIFFSLNWQDLPAFFEDHIQEWMQHFDTFLEYTNPILVDNSEEDEPGLIDQLHVAIVENLNLYAEKYDEEFKPFLQRFTQIIWSLLSSRITTHPKHDMLAAICMKFLKSVSSQAMNKGLFQEKSVLSEICTNIVVRNLQLRDSDEELFEDNPMDYIRRDIEGSDSDTRRSAAKELVRGLLRNFCEPVTQICLELVTKMLQEYTSDPANKWRLKDVSINLLIALAVQKESKAKGVSELNPGVPVMDFFTTHILPEFSDPNSSAKILKADAVKFVSTFRNQLSREMMIELMPMLLRLLLPEHFVVHTYAASCIERLLTVKEINGEPRFGRAQLSPYLSQILEGIFRILEQPNYPENDYLIKAIMRVLNVSKEDIVPVTDVAVNKLTEVLKRICANPSNPSFSHYLFESISVLVLNVCQTNTAATEQFENLLFPPFQSVLSADVEALCPYVYQVLALLLELRPHGVSAAYMSMFPVLLNPALWDRVSNVTALVKLIEAYIRKAPDQMSSFIQGILGVFQRLVAGRVTESSACSLLRAFFCYLPISMYASLFPEIIRILMMRLQSRINGRMGVVFVKDMLLTLSVFVGKNGSIPLFEAIEGLQQGMSQMLVEKVWVQHVLKVRGAMERKTCAIAMTRVLCEAPQVKSNAQMWGEMLLAAVKLMEEKEESAIVVDQDEELSKLEETGYEAGFSKLYFAAGTKLDYLSEIPSAKLYFAQSLSKLSTGQPQVYPAIAQQALPEKIFNVFVNYFSQAQVPFQ